MESAHVVSSGTVWSVDLTVGTYQVTWRDHNSPHTVLIPAREKLTYFHLLIQAVVEDERVSEGQAMGFHWVTLTCTGGDSMVLVTDHSGYHEPTIVEVSNVWIIKIGRSSSRVHGLPEFQLQHSKICFSHARAHKQVKGRTERNRPVLY